MIIFLTNNDMEMLKWILLVPVALILVLVVVAFIIRLINIHKDEAKRQAKIKENKDDSKSLELQECYGGKNNIVKVDLSMSRVSVEVKDLEIVKAEKIKELGANNVLLVGKTIKASYGDRASYIYNLLKGDNKNE